MTGEAMLFVGLLVLILLGLACVFLLLAKKRYSIEGKVSKAYQTQGEHYTVLFADGRSITFQNIPKRPVEPGKYYFIVYNGLKSLLSVEEWNE